MIKQTKKILLGGGLLAVLAFGGSALSQAGASPTNPAPAPVVKAKVPASEQTAGPDRDKVQSGDQTTPDTAGSSQAAEAPGAEAPDSPSSESSGSGESNGSEVPSNDGPGGHADEPGNANADHQFNGQE